MHTSMKYIRTMFMTMFGANVVSQAGKFGAPIVVTVP